MKISIKQRITLLCTLLIALIASAALLVMQHSEQQRMEQYYRSTLQSTHQLSSGDIAYVDGELEIDRNLDELPNVRVALFTTGGNLVYGQIRFELPFVEDEMRRAEGRDASWFVMDKLLDPEGGEPLWLRCYMSADVDGRTRSFQHELFIMLLPVLVLIAGAGGYIIARRAMRPVGNIVRTAETIADGADLGKRIALRGAKDEIYAIGQVFDDMLERLENSFERERRFTSDVSHELRIPVTSILAQSEYALSDSASDADRAAALSEIHASAEGMSALIRRLLALARMDAGQTVLSRSEIELGVMAQMAAEAVQPLAEEKGISVSTVGEARFVGDETMLLQALLNLMENAVRYGKTGGYVHVELSQDESAVKISVQDNGAGMDRQTLEHVFERFYQADSARHGGGFGLGLSLAERIVRLHDGHIAVESTPGEGSRFTIILPGEVRR